MDRRSFLKTTGVVAAGIPIISSCGLKKPNELITIGMIGVGSQGVERNLRHYLKYPE